MENLTEQALLSAVVAIRDKQEALSVKPTKLLLQGSWTEEEIAQAREIAERAHKEAFGE